LNNFLKKDIDILVRWPSAREDIGFLQGLYVLHFGKLPNGTSREEVSSSYKQLLDNHHFFDVQLVDLTIHAERSVDRTQSVTRGTDSSV
jgi:hypothetical protein